MLTPEEMKRRQEIGRVKAANEQELLKLPNVTGVFTGRKVKGGVDTGQIAIVVTVTEKQDVPAKQRVPKEIDGVPTDVIEEKIEPMKVANAVRLEDMVPMVDTTNYTTLEGGISIGPCRSFFLQPPEVPTAGNYVFTGTLGCIVRDNQTNAAMMLSNFHVMCVDDTWTVGDTMAQPSLVDGGACPADVVGTLTRAQLTAAVDAAVSTISARPNACAIVDIGDIDGTAVATVGMAVRKRGRTTGLTHGSVAATDYTTSVDYGDGLGVVTLTNQIRIVNDAAQSASFGNKGDSGSVVVDPDNHVVGLYFAGNTSGTVGVANPIAAVLAALDVSLCQNIRKIEKEWIPEKHWKVEFKEHSKEFFKDWKEYALEKFGQWEGVDPWRHDPWERFPVGINPPVVQPRVPGIGRRGGMAGPAGGAAIEDRLSRIEAALMGGTGAADPMWEVRTERGCLDFRRLTPGPGANPIAAPPFLLTVLDYTGAPLPNTNVVTWGGQTGLNAGWTVDIKIRGECPLVQATLVHFASGAMMEAYNDDGTLAGTATMTPTQRVAQTLTIQGTAIALVRIHCPQNETLLLRLCCCAETPCKDRDEEKPALADHKAVPKEKELKEFKEPLKEFKEPLKEIKEPLKELKEGKEPKELKEPKEIKEVREGGPGAPLPGGAMSVEERLARVEATLGGSGTAHFIPRALRPDLGQGALRYEPDQPGGRARLRRRV